MHFGVALGRLHPAGFLDVVQAAEELGYESVWLPEHLVFPTDMEGSPFPGGEHPPVPPSTPVFDAFAYLSFLAGRTQRLRLGTHVYLLGLRHPFVAARAIQTLDLVSGGRALVGVGAGWLESECRSAGVEFATRGRRLDEAMLVCKRLLSEEVVEHRGHFFSFEPVMFEPKPLQRPWPPMLVGGESRAALRRAATHGDGWVGLDHTLESVRAPIQELVRIRGEAETFDNRFDITVGARPRDRDEVERWEAQGVTRLIVAPWKRTRDAVSSLREFAARVDLRT